MSDVLSARFEQCYTGAVNDVMRAMGLRDFVLPPELRPLFPDRRLAGPAFTVLGGVAPDADPHATLLEWTGLLSRAKPGHVWISQPCDRTVAHMGELSAETLKAKGLRGCVIDGFVRDSSRILELGFDTFCRGFTPRDIVGWWLPKATETDIRVGDVVICPGDYLVGDRDGVVRVPASRAAEVVEATEMAIATENKVRKAILQGVDPQQAYVKYGKF